MGQKKSGVILNLNWVHDIFSLPSFVYLIKWYIIITYVSTKYVFVSYLVMFVCWHRKFTNQIADQVKKSFLTVCMMRVITFFLREIFDIETRFCGRVRGQNFYNSFYNKLLVHCRGAGMSKILVRTSLYMMGIICHWLESKSLYVSRAVSHFYGTEFYI